MRPPAATTPMQSPAFQAKRALYALHSLNGVSALLGFCRLSDTCALLSRALKFGSPDAAAELFARLQEEYHIIVSSVSGMQDKEYI